MGVNNFIPAVWSGLIHRALDKRFVFAARCNRNWEGEIKQAGDRVKILEIGPITVAPYAKNVTTISYQGIEDAGQYLEITESKYFAFRVDDVDKAQSKPEVVSEAMRKGGVAIADLVDQLIAAKYAEAGITANLGTEAVPLDINSANVVETLLLLGQLLDEASVPTEGRWIIVPPWLKTKILLAKIKQEIANTEVMTSGFVGRFLGLDVYVSNNGSANGTTCYRVMAGGDAITFASQVEKTEALRLEGSFSDGIRGLYLYGGKVVQPAALACLRCAPAAEAA